METPLSTASTCCGPFQAEMVQAMLSAIPLEDRVSVKDDIGTDSLFVAKPLKAKDYLLAQLHSIVIHVD